MRDRWYRELYKESSEEDSKRGSLTIGKYTIFENLPYEEFDYESNKTNKKAISSTTMGNIEELRRVKGLNVEVDKIIRANVATRRKAMSTFITGTIDGEEFIWARKEGNSAAAGQTIIYFKKHKVQASKFLLFVKVPIKPFLKKLDNGTYMVFNSIEGYIAYTTKYKEIKIGPDMSIFQAGDFTDLHRIIHPAFIPFSVDHLIYTGEIKVNRPMWFIENGVFRYTLQIVEGHGIILGLGGAYSEPRVSNTVDMENVKGFIDTYVEEVLNI